MLDIVPWAEGDRGLLKRLLGDPRMMEHLGGPESPSQLARRHRRYVDLTRSGEAQMFRVVWGPDAVPVGSVGFWDKTWHGQEVYEMGWSVLPGYQGRGIAVEATIAAVERARSQGRHRFVHAFPSVGNGASNAVCRKVGFELMGEDDFEYPKGHFMRCNDWRFDLEPTVRPEPTGT